jgi:hypothetical protein
MGGRLRALQWVALAVVLLWCTLALYWSNLPLGFLRAAAAAAFLIGAPWLVLRYRARYRTRLWFLGAAALILLWHLLIPASLDRNWREDQAVPARVSIESDLVTIRNIRNFTYRTVDDFTPGYYDRSFLLSELQSVDYAVEPFSTFSGAAHTFLTFGFKNGDHVAISIELRKEKGEDFSPLRAMFKQYELIYVIGDERDVIGLRANIRKDDVFLYPVRASPEKIRRLFREMVLRAENLATHPEFYHTFASSCTTNIVSHINTISPRRVPFSLKVLFPGYADELAYELGMIDTDLPLELIRNRYRINDPAGRHAGRPDFSQKIRENRPARAP